MSLTLLIFMYILVSLVFSGFASSQKLATDEGIKIYMYVLMSVYVTYFCIRLSSVYNEVSFFFSVAVDVLRAIAKGLHQNNWDFNVDPCGVASTVGGWRIPNADSDFTNAVTCNCSSSVCHVASMCVPTSLLFPLLHINN